ncbi:MAG: hypothetical protein MI746_08720 [Pseudomonadales bacterium]|nr:hypothetical protein [Pseudomonadales bacterium]
MLSEHAYHLLLLQKAYRLLSKELLLLEAGVTARSNHWQQRFQYWQYKKKKASQQRAEKKRSASKVGEDGQQANEEFSRDKAREEIAAAVARVKSKKSKNQAS